MATRFVQQARKTLDPLFAQQTKAVKGQIPAIQQLYDSLTQGLQFQNQQQLQTGTQNIIEDASARGVLRSSLPVDARTSLTGELGAALTEGLGRIGAQRAQDISGVNKSLADIGLQRTQSITSLADMLQGASLREREFKMQQQQAEREFQLKRQELAMSGSGGGGGRKLTDATLKSLSKGSDVDSIIDRIANAGGTQADIDAAFGIFSSSQAAANKKAKQQAAAQKQQLLARQKQQAQNRDRGYQNLTFMREFGGGFIRSLFGG